MTSGLVPLATIPIGAPVRDVVASPNGTRFYVLDGTGGSASVTVVSATFTVLTSLPAPADAIGIVVSTDGGSVFAPRAVGSDLPDRRIVGSARVLVPRGQAKAIAISPDGTTLYVLKGTAVENTAVVDVQTEAATKALPAPTHAVGLVVGVVAEGPSTHLSGHQRSATFRRCPLALK